MPLVPEMLWSAARITTAGDFRGTAFVVQVEGHNYVVTAHHLILNQLPLEVAIPDAFTGALHEPFLIPEADRRQPFDGIDLVYAPLPYIGRAVRRVELGAHAAPNGYIPNLGGDLFYVGIFEPLQTPMVRSGTLATPPVTITKEPNDENPARYEYSGCLVDCRSYEGFSGSPCFVRLQYPNLSEPAEMPVPVPREAQGDKLFATASLAVFVGMFTSHYDDEDSPANPARAASRYGVGVMLPVDYIRNALMTDEAKQERAEKDAAAAAAAERTGGPVLKDASAGRAASGDEFERFEDLTRQLVNTPKPKSD